MQTTAEQKRIAKLEEKRARVNAEIRRVKARANQRKRKEDTRRKILLGAYLLANWDQDQIREAMDGFLTKSRDRQLFGL